MQINDSGQLKHCLSINGLKKKHLLQIFKQASDFLTPQGNLIPATSIPHSLQGATVANLFFEPSTRTRCSFELAAKYLGANVLNFNEKISSRRKGETLIDTARNLEAMGVSFFVIRHNTPGTANLIAQHAKSTSTVLNAGDGTHEHPSQALLDTFTLWRRNTDFSQCRIAIIGDIAHSRVARSQINAFSLLGATDVRVIAPNNLFPTDIDTLGVTPYTDLKKGLSGVDVIITLRLQKERMAAEKFSTLNDFHQHYGISTQTLAFAAPDAIVMHPGPIERGVEITSEVADSERALILQQVTNGVAIRMALFTLLNPDLG